MNGCNRLPCHEGLPKIFSRPLDARHGLRIASSALPLPGSSRGMAWRRPRRLGGPDLVASRGMVSGC